MFYMFIVVEC